MVNLLNNFLILQLLGQLKWLKVNQQIFQQLITQLEINFIKNKLKLFHLALDSLELKAFTIYQLHFFGFFLLTKNREHIILFIVHQKNLIFLKMEDTMRTKNQYKNKITNAFMKKIKINLLIKLNNLFKTILNKNK